MESTKQPSSSKISLTCDECGTAFERYAVQHRNGTSFCSSKCYTRSRASQIKELTCANCKSNFKTPLRGRERKYCSADCSVTNKVIYEMRPCVICTKTVRVDIRKNTKVLCSKQCSWTSLKAVRPTSVQLKCQFCEKNFDVSWDGRKRLFCSRACGSYSKLEGPERAMRKAVVLGDYKAFLRVLRNSSMKTSKGCWEPEFLYSVDKGYPLFRHGDSKALHRVVSTIVYGTPIQWAQSHHKCANTKCVNPKHLQWVTAKANEAEMLERNWYIRRIAMLEARLAKVEAELEAKSTEG